MSVHSLINDLDKADAHDKSAVIDAVEVIKKHIFDSGHTRGLCAPYADNSRLTPGAGELFALLDGLYR